MLKVIGWLQRRLVVAGADDGVGGEAGGEPHGDKAARKGGTGSKNVQFDLPVRCGYTQAGLAAVEDAEG